MMLHKAFQVRWASHSQLSAELRSHPSGSDGSCGVYGTINNMWLYFLCVVSFQRLMRADKTFLFFCKCNIAAPVAPSFSPNAGSIVQPNKCRWKKCIFISVLRLWWDTCAGLGESHPWSWIIFSFYAYVWIMFPPAGLPDSAGLHHSALLRPSGQWFHVSTQPNFNLTSHPDDYTSLRSNKGSFGVCPVSQSQIFCRCFSPCSSCPMPDWSSLERDSCLLLQELCLETSGQCSQSTYFILCIRFPHRSVCVTQANKSFCAYSLFPRSLKSTQLYYHVPNRWSR